LVKYAEPCGNDAVFFSGYIVVQVENVNENKKYDGADYYQGIGTEFKRFQVHW